jgi:hypothetical protein
MATHVSAGQKPVVVTYDVPGQEEIEHVGWRNSLYAQALRVAADAIETDGNFAGVEIGGARFGLDELNDVVVVVFDIVPG